MCNQFAYSFITSPVVTNNALLSLAAGHSSSFTNKCILPIVQHLKVKPSALWDDCCSHSVTNNLSMLYAVTKLPTPITLGGIVGGCLLTHTGFLHSLPSINDMNRAYYSPTIATTLFSLGHLQRSGGSYHTVSTDQLYIYASDKLLLNSPIMNGSNLYPVDFHQLSTALPTIPPAVVANAAFPHVNNEQRKRCELVQDLLVALGFPSDGSLSNDLSSGKITPLPFSTLTAQDVTLNRLLRGPCPHAAAGKYRSAPHYSSMSAPATRPGQTISFDLQRLPTPSPGGFTEQITLVDEQSGQIGIVGSVSKRTPDVL